MKARKGLALKPNKLLGKKSTTTKIFQDWTGTPATKGLPLLQQISSAGLKQSSKKKQAIHVKTSDEQRVKVEQDHCQKETMFPFTDKGMVNGVILLHVNRKITHGANTTTTVQFQFGRTPLLVRRMGAEFFQLTLRYVLTCTST